ncbi:MAG: Mur ligase family protein [Oscillospiraceae bacterium]|nr:Mur ligase family protein [Oscillospiraceae bacterium]
MRDLSRFSLLCKALGEPQNGQRFVHIAGTNGKGSISEYIATALTAHGLKVGKFTSPYILRINERIKIDYQDIDDDILSGLLKEVEVAVKKTTADYSQFELLTAAAFIYFKRESTDIAIIETGIGGALDCTNVIKPELTVISKIDYDHCDVLGERVVDIARHKAGIIKKGVACVVSPNIKEVSDVLNAAAQAVGAAVTTVDEKALHIKEMSLFGNSFSYKGVDFNTTMGGRHQVINAVTAVEALQLLNVSQTAIKRGLNTAVLKARMQVVSSARPTIVVDGAHNPSAVVAAVELTQRLPCRKIIVFGILNNKDYSDVLGQLAKMADEFVLVDDFSPNARKTADLLTALSQFRFNKNDIHIKKTNDAIEFAKQKAQGGLVMSCGSLYLAGKVLKKLTVDN